MQITRDDSKATHSIGLISNRSRSRAGKEYYCTLQRSSVMQLCHFSNFTSPHQRQTNICLRSKLAGYCWSGSIPTFSLMYSTSQSSSRRRTFWESHCIINCKSDRGDTKLLSNYLEL